nr:reverse transcriptase domain-containing protein [Tanacetum cinerariifolium]
MLRITTHRDVDYFISELRHHGRWKIFSKKYFGHLLKSVDIIPWQMIKPIGGMMSQRVRKEIQTKGVIAIGPIGPSRPFKDRWHYSSIVRRSRTGRSPFPSAAISKSFKRVGSARDLLRIVSSGLSRGDIQEFVKMLVSIVTRKTMKLARILDLLNRVILKSKVLCLNSNRGNWATRPFKDGWHNSSIVRMSGTGGSLFPSAAISKSFKRVGSTRDLLWIVSSGLARANGVKGDCQGVIDWFLGCDWSVAQVYPLKVIWLFAWLVLVGYKFLELAKKPFKLYMLIASILRTSEHSGTFVTTLDQLAAPTSIDSYDDLKKAFLANYLQQKKCIKDPVEIYHIKQRKGESTEDFMQRFKVESRHVKGAPKCMRIYGFMHGITNLKLIKRLHDNISKSVDEMMRATTAFLRGEATTKVKRWEMPTWCHMFNFTRTESARVWFDDLPPESIDSYDDLKKAFLANYLQQKKCIKDPVEIYHIKKRKGESTEDFMQRFKVESRHVKRAPKCMRIYGFMHGITNLKLIKRLHDNISKSVDEMMRATTAFLRGEGESNISTEEETFGTSKAMDMRGNKPLYSSNPYFELPKKSWMPSNVKTYDRSGDHEDQLKIFQVAAKVERWKMPTWCHMFNSTLTESTREWVDDLPPESIDSYDDLKKAFLANNLQQKKCIKDLVEIHNIKQRDGESTEDFMQIFKVESRHVKGAPECMRISGFTYGITNPELIKRLHDNIPKSVDEMMRATTAFLRGEVAASNQARKKMLSPANMTGVSRHIAEHRLNIREGYPLARQKKRALGETMSRAIEKGMQSGLSSGIDHGKASRSLADSSHKDASVVDIMDILRLKSPLAGAPRISDLQPDVEQLMLPIHHPEDRVVFSETSFSFALSVSHSRVEGIRENILTQMLALDVWKKLLGTLKKHEAESKKMYLRGRRRGVPRIQGQYQRNKDFIVEHPEEDSLDTPMEVEEELPEPWILFTDGSSCVDGSGAGLVLTNLEGAEFTYALRFCFAHLSKQALVEELKEKSINELEVLAVEEEEGDTWMALIYKPLQANYVLKEIHEGFYSMHADTRSVVAKALQTGYYWLTMHKDARALIRACQDCQVYRPILRNPQQKLTPITSPWPCYKWGIDIVEPFSKGPGKVKSLTVAIDYFKKWIEANSVASITGNQVKKFMWDNIVCKFRILGEIISDNGKQFRDNPFKYWCEKLFIPAEIGIPTLRTVEVDMMQMMKPWKSIWTYWKKGENRQCAKLVDAILLSASDLLFSLLGTCLIKNILKPLVNSAPSRFVSTSPALEPSTQDDPSVNKIHGSGSSSSTSMGVSKESSSGCSTMKSAKMHSLTDTLGLYCMAYSPNSILYFCILPATSDLDNTCFMGWSVITIIGCA